MQTLEVAGVQLKFFLFDTEWSLLLGELVFLQRASTTPENHLVTATYPFPQEDAHSALLPSNRRFKARSRDF